MAICIPNWLLWGFQDANPPPTEGRGGAAEGAGWSRAWGGRTLTLQLGSLMLSTKAVASLVQERTVSVRPSRKSRVMEAS